MCEPGIAPEFDAFTRPLAIAFEDGRNVYLKIDMMVKEAGLLILGGWLSEKIAICAVVNGKTTPLLKQAFFNREDVNRHLHTDPHYEHGFALCIEAGDGDVAALRIPVCKAITAIPLPNEKAVCGLPDGIEAVVSQPVIDFIRSRRQSGHSWKNGLEAGTSPYRCGIDHVYRWPDAKTGYPIVITGWLAIPEGFSLYAGDPECRQTQELKPAFFNRPDIALDDDVFFCPHPHGFTCVLKGYDPTKDRVSFYIGKNGDMCRCLTAPVTNFYGYRSFIKTLFEIDIDSCELAQVYSAALFPLFCELQRLRASGLRALPVRTGAIGRAQSSPQVSVIVPLYASLQHLEEQVKRLAWDRSFQDLAELIYVLDDPGIYDSFRININMLHRRYGIAAKWACYNASQGFSGACNLGASVAKGRLLVFMNSDVYPDTPGWIDRLQECFANNPAAGIAGCHLVNQDGSSQECGADLIFDAALGIWQCHRLLEACPERGAKAVQEADFLTGAFMAIRKSDFNEVGGFCPDYLIGNSEDLDLCMKIKSSGKKIYSLPQIRMVHISHSSFDKLAKGKWHDRLWVYNAALFAEKWKDALKRDSDPATR